MDNLKITTKPNVIKAWLVRERDEFLATVVFAETRGKAKSIALTTETCEDCDFCNIEVHRVQRMDKYYKPGKTEMDWCDPIDRLALVKECGFTCDYDYRCESECQECSAREICDDYLSEED